jgi:hypothetical protein
MTRTAFTEGDGVAVTPRPPTDLATTGELETPARLRPGSPVGGPDSHVHTLRGGFESDA